MLKDFNKRLTEKKVLVDLSFAAKEHFATIGYDQNYGARPLRRVFQRELEDYMAVQSLKGVYDNPTKILVDLAEGKLVYTETPWTEYKEAPKKDGGSSPSAEEKDLALV